MYTYTKFLSLILLGILAAAGCKPRSALYDDASQLRNAVCRDKKAQTTADGQYVKCSKANAALEDGVQFASVPPAIIGRKLSGRDQTTRHWGTPYNIEILTAAAVRVYAEFEQSDAVKQGLIPDPLVIGDMSQQQGGNIGHKSHRMGLDTDVSYYDNRGAGQKPVDQFLDYSKDGFISYFDAERNLRFVELLHEEATRCGTSIPFIFSVTPLIKKLYAQYGKSTNGGRPTMTLAEFQDKFNLRYAHGHGNHFHVRVGYLRFDKCVNSGPKNLAEVNTVPQILYPYPLPPETAPNAAIEREVVNDDDPYGDHCGYYKAKAGTTASPLGRLSEGANVDAAKGNGESVNIPEGQLVVCLENSSPRAKVQTMTFRIYTSADEDPMSSMTYLAQQTNFERASEPAGNPGPYQNGDNIDQVSESTPSAAGNEVDCSSSTGNDLRIATEDNLAIHFVNPTNNRIGMVIGFLKRGDVIQIQAAGPASSDTASQWNQWTKATVLSGASKGKRGAMVSTYLNDFSKQQCAQRSSAGQTISPQ